MTIEDRIKSIREKPENVRMVYIFILVTIVMTFIVVLWIFSLRVDVRAIVNNVNDKTILPDNGGQLQDIKDAINHSNDAIDTVIQRTATGNDIEALPVDGNDTLTNGDNTHQ